jgi:hypothetical protein
VTTTKEKKERRINERKFVKLWMGAIVHPLEDNSVLLKVIGVDVARGMIWVAGGEWVPCAAYTMLKSTKKKHWKRSQQQYVNN